MYKENKKLVAETIFIKEALKDKLTLNEFLLLLYFDNSFELVFDIDLIKKTINMSEEDILAAYGSLMSKKLIKVSAKKNSFGKIVEYVSLENFYNGIKEDHKLVEKENVKGDIFSVFENNFGKTLSAMECELINAWIDRGDSEELIIAALKEATYNGVRSLRYIDKILFEWNKKGIKTPEEVEKNLVSDNEAKLLETSVLNFDWLNESH